MKLEISYPSHKQRSGQHCKIVNVQNWMSEQLYLRLISDNLLLQVRVERNRIVRAREFCWRDRILLDFAIFYILPSHMTYILTRNVLKCVEYIMSYYVWHICIVHDAQICPLQFTGAAYAMSYSWHNACLIHMRESSMESQYYFL